MLGRQTMKKRVVITGIGAITPLGNDALTTWDNIKKGVSGIAAISKFDMENYNVKVAGEVKDFNPDEFMDAKEARRMGRFTQFAVAASKMAVMDAKVKIGENADPERVGVWIGSGHWRS